jgi:hypothetical protein
MFAIRQIIEDPQDMIAIPPELRHRRTEVIFIALEPEKPDTSTIDTIDAFRGKGKGGAVSRLLVDRQAEREQEE